LPKDKEIIEEQERLMDLLLKINILERQGEDVSHMQNDFWKRRFEVKKLMI